MLVRWCRVVVSISLFQQFTVFWGADVVNFGARKVSFGMPVASTLAPWVTLERSRGTWEHETRYLGVQAWMPIDFGWTLGPYSETCWVTLEQHLCFFVWLFPGRVKSFGCPSLVFFRSQAPGLRVCPVFVHIYWVLQISVMFF